MGQGSAVLFNDFAHAVGQGRYDFRSGASDIEIILATNALVPVKTATTPERADYTECSGGTYVNQALANEDWVLGGIKAYQSDFTADDVTFAQDAGAGPVNCYYAIACDDNAPSPCLWFWDLTPDAGVTPLSLRDAPIILNLGAGTRQLFYALIAANA